MAAKKKSRAKGKRKTVTKTFTIRARHPGGDLVSIQLSAQVHGAKGLKLTKAVLSEMVRIKAESSTGYWDGKTVVGAAQGTDPRGIKLRITRWRNPTRKNPGARGWRTGSQAHAWGSLRAPLAAAGASFR